MLETVEKKSYKGLEVAKITCHVGLQKWNSRNAEMILSVK